MSWTRSFRCREGDYPMVPVTALNKGLRILYIDFHGDHTMHALIADEGGQRTTICIDGRKNSPTRSGVPGHSAKCLILVQ
jgi:hypothetical protein